MSDFFEWIGEFTPAIIWFMLWASAFPIRVMCMLVLPRNAENRYHMLHPVYDFFAFYRR